MRALVVIDSLWGSTETVARAVARELSAQMSVDVVDSDSAPMAGGYDLVVVGHPSHASGMSAADRRDETARMQGLSWTPQRGIGEWLAALPSPRAGERVASFETCVDAPSNLAGGMVAESRSFHVHGYEGPLVEGELDSAVAWARSLIAS